MDSNPIRNPSPAKKVKCSFLDYDRPGWSMDSNPVHHPSPAKKNKMLIFGLCSTFDDWPGWLMDLNPVYHSSPAKKMKCSFLDYVQLLMIGRVGQWTWTPSTTPLQPKKWNARFWITFNFWWSVGLVDGLELHPPPLSSQTKKMLIFGLRSTSDDQPSDLSDESSSKCEKVKCCFS